MSWISTTVFVTTLGLGGSLGATAVFGPAGPAAVGAPIAVAKPAAATGPGAVGAPSLAPVDRAGRPAAASSASLTPAAADRAAARSGWAWPIDPVPRVVARFDPPDTRYGAGHRGVDLAATVGTAVRAPTEGTVSFSGMVAGRPVLVLAHAGGLRSTFEPASSPWPAGTPVHRGEAIGVITSHPGHCRPATCLHWGVPRGEIYLDPLALVSGRVVLLPMR